MDTLNEIAQRCQTDKATVCRGAAGCCFAPHYDFIFGPLRDRPIRLLEIGVAGGASIRMWLDYFRRAEIVGVDISDSLFRAERFTYVVGDQSSREFWAEFLWRYSAFDIIIDDGGHQNQQVVTSFECLWPYVKSGGFYAVENLPIARGTGLVSPGWPEHMDWVKDKMPFDFDSQFDALHFFRELVIFRKK
jgi:hypothetical protein